MHLANPLLDVADCALMVIDVQGKLATTVADGEAVIDRITRLVKAAKLLSLPVIWVEQNPQGLGPTVTPIANVLDDTRCYEKSTFNAMATSAIASAVTGLDRPHILVCGIEAHVCVYQSVCGLLNAGKDVSVLEDCVSSRAEANRRTAITRMARLGSAIRSMEMALFELLGDAAHPMFKQVLPLIK